MLLAGLAAAAPPNQELVTLKAMRQQWVQDELWCGVGEVQVRYQDISLRCDEVEVDLKTMKLHAQGNVIFDQGDTHLGCSHLDFDLNQKIGTLYDVSGTLPPSYHFKGEELEKLDETHWRFHHGIFTSCTLGDTAPPWSIEVRDAVLELEGYGHFRGVAMKARGLPVFYTPRLLWPVKRERATGFLVPNIGYNNRRGFYLGNAFFWPISRSFDATTYIDAYSKGYLGLGQELRWAPVDNASGQILPEILRNPNQHKWEWKVRGQHTQLFPGGWALRAEVNDLSNPDFFQSFERTFEQNALRSLFSYLQLARNWGPQVFNLRFDRRETFFNFGAQRLDVTLIRRPELEYRLRPTRIGLTPLYVSAVGVADEFNIDRSPSLRGSYGRFDLFPTVSLLMPGLAWLNVTPNFGVRETYYSHTYHLNALNHLPETLVPEPLSRTYTTAGVAIVGPSFSRVWARADGGKVKHLIEPRIDYGYVSNPGDGTRIPLFDEKDFVLVTNRLRATLGNRVFLKTPTMGSREIVTFEIAQDYSFSTPLTPALPPAHPSQRGPLNLWLRAQPAPTTALDARAAFDPITKNLLNTAVAGTLFQGPANMNMTWYTAYNPANGDVISSQARLFAGFSPTAKPWRLETQFAYDIHFKKLLEQRFVLRWRGSCWSLYAEVRDYKIAPFKTRDYRIALDLTGLGTFLDIRGGLDSLGF